MWVHSEIDMVHDWEAPEPDDVRKERYSGTEDISRPTIVPLSLPFRRMMAGWSQEQIMSWRIGQEQPDLRLKAGSSALVSRALLWYWIKHHFKQCQGVHKQPWKKRCPLAFLQSHNTTFNNLPHYPRPSPAELSNPGITFDLEHNLVPYSKTHPWHQYPGTGSRYSALEARLWQAGHVL